MDSTVPLMVCCENEVTPILQMRGQVVKGLTAGRQLRLDLNTGLRPLAYAWFWGHFSGHRDGTCR